jgi:hypothetical protein
MKHTVDETRPFASSCPRLIPRGTASDGEETSKDCCNLRAVGSKFCYLVADVVVATSGATPNPPRSKRLSAHSPPVRRALQVGRAHAEVRRLSSARWRPGAQLVRGQCNEPIKRSKRRSASETGANDGQTIEYRVGRCVAHLMAATGLHEVASMVPMRGKSDVR